MNGEILNRILYIAPRERRAFSYQVMFFSEALSGNILPFSF